jgi:hypothetical protein
MPDAICLGLWVFVLVFGSLGLCLCIACANVAGHESDEERKRGE